MQAKGTRCGNAVQQHVGISAGAAAAEKAVAKEKNETIRGVKTTKNDEKSPPRPDKQ
jgi:hypothetical protein